MPTMAYLTAQAKCMQKRILLVSEAIANVNALHTDMSFDKLIVLRVAFIHLYIEAKGSRKLFFFFLQNLISDSLSCAIRTKWFQI